LQARRQGRVGRRVVDDLVDRLARGQDLELPARRLHVIAARHRHERRERQREEPPARRGDESD